MAKTQQVRIWQTIVDEIKRLNPNKNLSLSTQVNLLLDAHLNQKPSQKSPPKK